MGVIEWHDGGEPRPAAGLSDRSPGDDFVCLRYRVWYSSFDCAFRTRHRTCPGCFDCEQGRFNLRRHADVLARVRLPVIA